MPAPFPRLRRSATHGSAASAGVLVAGLLGGLLAPAAHADPPPVRATGLETTTIAEFHYTPVPNAQIAIWLEDAEGNFLRDVFVTQAVGKLGIGNRSGVWNFLSSWRAPYGPRRSVLPIWAHRRGRVYPEIVWHDPLESHATSLGFHEGTSSAEPYHCRPLTPTEHEEILDSMTCPSPQVFKTDKGRFEPGGATSVYPPRGDIASFDPQRDHDDVQLYAELNDLDSITGATPAGDVPTFQAVQLTDLETAHATIRAWIEISLEDDQNADWSFDRDTDHFVDPLLAAYGVPWLGQPSVVYRVDFDPRQRGFRSTTTYAGYGDWDGATGTVHPPDATIETSGRSGADRLQVMEGFGESFRFGVQTGKGGACAQTPLSPVRDLTVAPIAFDRVGLTFELPPMPSGAEVSRLVVRHQLADADVDPDALSAAFDPSAALDVSSFAPTICTTEGQSDCETVRPGDTIELEVPQLFGNYTYAFAVSYQDRCANEAAPSVELVTTPEQEFAQIEGLCFVATAAYGAPWEPHVEVLRRFRDAILRPDPVGRTFVALYYAYGPSFARLVARDDQARAVTRAALTPVVGLAAAALGD